MKFLPRRIVTKTRNTCWQIYASIYMGIFSYYLGQAVINLNEIDDRILDHSLYFFVYFKPNGKEFHEQVVSRTMGTKLRWLINVAEGETEKKRLPPEKTGLSIATDAAAALNTEPMKELLKIMDELIKDVRNPLVHSRYYFVFSKKYGPISQKHNFHFTEIKISDMRSYLHDIKNKKQQLLQLIIKAGIEIFSK